MISRLDLDLMLRRHGWRTLLPVCMVLACGILAASHVPADAPEIVQPLDAGRQLEERHRAFRSILLTHEALVAGQREVLAEVQRHGLSFGRIDYGFDRHDAGRFGIATLQLPVRGAYVDFRGFLAAILSAHPALSIDDLSIRRLADSSGIEARLRVAFHVMLPEGEQR